MDLKELIPQKLKEKFPSVEFELTEYRDELTIKFDKKFIVEVCTFLKSNPDLEFSWCSDVTAIDWATRKNRFTVVYNIFSSGSDLKLMLMNLIAQLILYLLSGNQRTGRKEKHMICMELNLIIILT